MAIGGETGFVQEVGDRHGLEVPNERRRVLRPAPVRLRCDTRDHVACCIAPLRGHAFRPGDFLVQRQPGNSGGALDRKRQPGIGLRHRRPAALMHAGEPQVVEREAHGFGPAEHLDRCVTGGLRCEQAGVGEPLQGVHGGRPGWDRADFNTEVEVAEAVVELLCRLGLTGIEPRCRPTHSLEDPAHAVCPGPGPRRGVDRGAQPAQAREMCEVFEARAARQATRQRQAEERRRCERGQGGTVEAVRCERQDLQGVAADRFLAEHETAAHVDVAFGACDVGPRGMEASLDGGERGTETGDDHANPRVGVLGKSFACP